MDRLKYYIPVFILISIVFLQSCGDKKVEKEKLKPEVMVKIEKASLDNSPDILSFSGNIEAEIHSNISTRIMGQIAKIHVVPGQKVNQGDMLMNIKSNDIKAKKSQVNANLTAAKSAFTNAEKDYKRYNTLFSKGSASQKEMDDITTHYNMTKANLKAVKQMGKEVDELLRYADIRAPYSGVITKKYMNEGDMASPGMPLLAIEKNGGFIVKARVPESEIVLVKKGDKVKVKIKAMGDIMVEGEISEVNPSAIYTGNQYEARVVLKPSKDVLDKIFTGMYVSVLLSKGGIPAIMVPKDVLIKRGQLTGVYVISLSGTAMLRWVRTGKSIGDKIEILSGLSDGDKYIRSYKGKLYDGAVVKQE